MNDMQPNGPLFHKPRSILAAKNILYAGIFLAILNGVLYYWVLDIPVDSHLQVIGMLGVNLLLLYALTHLVGLGKKWARTILLFFLILMTLYFYHMVPVFRLNLVMGFLSGLLFLLELAALVFLFSKDSNEWFNRMEGQSPANIN
jgi:hypothetical protein